jgi:hypothetical protein
MLTFDIFFIVLSAALHEVQFALLGAPRLKSQYGDFCIENAEGNCLFRISRSLSSHSLTHSLTSSRGKFGAARRAPCVQHLLYRYRF